MAGKVISFFRDGLANIVSGAGGAADKRAYARYFLNRLDPVQIDAMYRSSWLMRKVVDLPPYDMTRAGRDWKTDKAAIAKLEAEEKRLQVWPKLLRALVLGRLGGGALILGTADGRPDQPLDAAAVRAGGLRYIVPVSRYQLTIGELITDPEDPLFMQPKLYRLQSAKAGQADIHPSRVIPFKGLPVAAVGNASSADEVFWGDSVLQSVQDAVKNADLAQGGFASLIDEAKIDIYKIPGLTSLAASAEYETALTKRMTTSNLFKSQFNALLLDAGASAGEGEEWDQRQVNWSGIPDIIRTYLAIVAGAADIPATRLLGKSPDGQNATGESDEANYWTMIAAKQQSDLRPALDILDPILAASAGVTGDLFFEFAPLKVLGEKEQAEVNKTKADTVKVYADAGLVPEIALEKAVQNLLVEDAWLPGLEEALDELPDDERFPSLAEPTDPAELGLVDPTKGGDPASAAMGGGLQPAALARAANDAAPRTLYVSRKLLNAAEFIRWAKGQGFDTTTPADELHVTIAFSRQPVDWMKVGDTWSSDKKGELVVAPGGPRIVEPLGDKGEVVLFFTSSELSWRHEQIKRDAGASWDFEEYQPHVTITYRKPDGLDLSKVEPYRGELRFGPEIFAEVQDGWERRVTEE